MNITSSGIVSPTGNSDITIPLGGRVHFFNKDTVARQIDSDCPELKEAQPIPPGGNDLRPVMNSSNLCPLRDFTTQTALGQVTVSSAPPSGGGGGGAGY